MMFSCGHTFQAGIFYSTQTGNTETVAGYIADAAGLAIADIGDASDADIAALDTLIVGAPTRVQAMVPDSLTP